MMSPEARAREDRACDAARRVIGAADRAAGEAALAELALPADDAALLRLALGGARRDLRAMMLGKAAVSLVHFVDAAAAIGVARALEAYWAGEGWAAERDPALARVELGSALTIAAQGLARWGEVARVLALVGAHPGSHDKRRHLAIVAAEALARSGRLDEARAMLPARPAGDLGEEAAWDVAHNLLADVAPEEDASEEDGAAASGAIEERWGAVIDRLQNVLAQAGQRAGIPAVIGTLLVARLEQERAEVPANEAAFRRRVNALTAAMERPGR